MKKIVNFVKDHVGNVAMGGVGLALLLKSFTGFKNGPEPDDHSDDGPELVVLEGSDDIEDILKEGSEE